MTTVVSKKQLAGVIFAKLTEQKVKRVDIIKAMVAEAGLTMSGAGTYYQNFKSGAWEAVPKVAVDPKAGVNFESMTEAELVTWFNEHSGLAIKEPLFRDDIMALINRFI